MRFRGTLILLLICAALGRFVYFYEIKGGETAREGRSRRPDRLWKVESANIQQIDLVTPQEHITAVRKGEKEWKITAPRAVDADSDELNRIAGSAAEITRESVLETNAKDLARFGLEPPQLTLQVKTKDGKEYEVRYGESNPTGNSTYAAMPGSKRCRAGCELHGVIISQEARRPAQPGCPELRAVRDQFAGPAERQGQRPAHQGKRQVVAAGQAALGG